MSGDRLTALDASFLQIEDHSAHMHVASVTHAIAPVNRTNELVQSDLLIGNDQCHMRPSIIASAPTANSPESRS